MSLVGLDTASGTDPIASYVPLMMFAVLFGLSMDYQVFLISRIEQHRAEGGTDSDAIRRGLAGGARVIVAAALIMICGVRELRAERRPDREAVWRRPLGGRRARRGLRARVRAAVLVLAGKGSWWLPAWLDRRLAAHGHRGSRRGGGGAGGRRAARENVGS